MIHIKSKVLSIFILIMSLQSLYAQHTDAAKKIEQDIIELSNKKWKWMSEKQADSLQILFDEKCNFVHMGGTWGKDREVDIIKSGFIWYKKAEVYSTSVQVYGNTAILLSDIDLVAVVGQNDAINPFMVTEVFVNENGKWKLGQLTFSHLMRPLKLNTQK